MEKEKFFLKTRFIVFLTIGISIVIFYSIWKIINHFSIAEAGQWGDTIGGVSAPLINLLGAILVYYSFIVQYKANLQQFKAYRFDKEFALVQKMIEIIKEQNKQIKHVNNLVGTEAKKGYLQDLTITLQKHTTTKVDNKVMFSKESIDSIKGYDHFPFLQQATEYYEYFILALDKINSSELSEIDKKFAEKLISIIFHSQDDPIHSLLSSTFDLFNKHISEIPAESCENIKNFLAKAVEVHFRLKVKIEIKIADVKIGNRSIINKNKL